MLTPVEICEQLTVDEFIGLCQQLKPFKFDVIDMYRQDSIPVVYVSCDDRIYRVEAKPWPISA